MTVLRERQDDPFRLIAMVRRLEQRVLVPPLPVQEKLQTLLIWHLLLAYTIEVGYVHGAKPGNIVGAIANEADISSKNIGAIDIHDNYTLVDLPDSLPNQAKETLQKTRVAAQRLNIREWSDEPPKKRKK